MATQLFFTNTASTAPTPLATSNTVTKKTLDTARGATSAVTVGPVSTIASLGTTLGVTSLVHPWGATASVSISGGGTNWPTNSILFYFGPINAVTISGSITSNIRGLESGAMANYAAGFSVIQMTAAGIQNLVAHCDPAAEFGTSETNLTLGSSVTSTAFSTGDYILIVPCFVGFGTSSSGFTASGFYNGAAAGSGDISITFTETITLAPTATLLAQPSFFQNSPAMMMQGLRDARKSWRKRRSGLVVPKLWLPGPVAA